MSGGIIEQVSKAQRFYYLATKYQDKIPVSVGEFAKKICNDYTKMAKDKKIVLNNNELFKLILK